MVPIGRALEIDLPSLQSDLMLDLARRPVDVVR